MNVVRSFGEKQMAVELYSLPSLEEGMYRYGMASGVTFESRHADAQEAYDVNLQIRVEQERLAKERAASKGESDKQTMRRIMKACIACHTTKMLSEGSDVGVKDSDEMVKFVKDNVKVEVVMRKYFKVGRHVGHFVHSPREIFSLCMNENVDEVVGLVMKGATKPEDRCYMQAASLTE